MTDTISIHDFNFFKESLKVIDVREPWEYDEYNLNHTNVPLADLPNNLNELKQFDKQGLVVICKLGNRSNQAMKYLKKQGFLNVRSLAGGIEALMNT